MAADDEYLGDEMIRGLMREHFAGLDNATDEAARREIQFSAYQNGIFLRDFELLEAVLDSGIAVDAPVFHHGATGLLLAVSGSTRAVQLLLNRGACVNVEDWEGVTPLGNAVSGGRTAIVKLLLDHGADPSYRTFWGMPLERALRNGHAEIADLLRASGADDSSATKEAGAAGFSSFVPLFEYHQHFNAPLALYLTNFTHIDTTLAALDAMRTAIARSSDPQSEVMALLGHYNWRWQLIGAFAILLGVSGSETTNALWAAFDSGSTVSPHMAVVAQRCDETFESQAQRRLEAGCPLTSNRFADFAWYARSDNARPQSLDEAPFRARAALTALCCEMPSVGSWLSEIAAHEIEPRWQNHARTALSWQQRIDAVLGKSRE